MLELRAETDLDELDRRYTRILEGHTKLLVQLVDRQDAVEARLEGIEAMLERIFKRLSDRAA